MEEKIEEEEEEEEEEEGKENQKSWWIIYYLWLWGKKLVGNSTIINDHANHDEVDDVLFVV